MYVYNDIFNFIQIAGLLSSWMASKIGCKTEKWTWIRSEHNLWGQQVAVEAATAIATKPSTVKWTAWCALYVTIYKSCCILYLLHIEYNFCELFLL